MHDTFLCQQVPLILNFFCFPLTLEKSAEVLPVFAALWPAAPCTCIWQWHPPSIHPSTPPSIHPSISSSTYLQWQTEPSWAHWWNGWPWGCTVVSMWFPQFRISPHCYLQIPLFSLRSSVCGYTLPSITITTLFSLRSSVCGCTCPLSPSPPSPTRETVCWF